MEPQEEHNEAEKGKRNMEKLFDLQVFAQENTQTTGGLSAEMKTYYGMELLDNAKPQLVHNQFAATKPLPTGGGKTVEWRKFGSFDKALTPLTEGVTPDGSGISVSYITKELAQYGDYTTVSDMLDLTAIDDVVLEITDRHGANMGLTLDTVTRNEIQQGKQVLYAPAIGADGRKTEVTARGALTPDQRDGGQGRYPAEEDERPHLRRQVCVHPTPQCGLRSAAGRGVDRRTSVCRCHGAVLRRDR